MSFCVFADHRGLLRKHGSVSYYMMIIMVPVFVTSCCLSSDVMAHKGCEHVQENENELPLGWKEMETWNTIAAGWEGLPDCLGKVDRLGCYYLLCRGMRLIYRGWGHGLVYWERCMQSHATKTRSEDGSDMTSRMSTG
jgi:hypothetical protein